MTSPEDHTTICPCVYRPVILTPGTHVVRIIEIYIVALLTPVNPWHTFCSEVMVCGLCVFGYGSATRKGRKLRITRGKGVGSLFLHCSELVC